MKFSILAFVPVMMLCVLPLPAASIIERIPTLQPVRISYVKAAASYSGKQIDWKISCYTIDENNGAYAAVADTVNGTGDSVQVRLIKYALQYTFYKIAASSGIEKDSIELQVFSKGSMQKYLNQIPVYPAKPVPVYVYLPASFSSSSKLLVAMHGIDRNAYNYGLAWTAYAAANNTVVIAPEFNAANWTSDAYSLGNMFTGSDGTGSFNIKEKWTFTIVKDIVRKLSKGFGLSDSSYSIWGHSAGAQFIHRMLLFASDPMIKTAIAGNAGWYTVPDSTAIFPWGVKHPFLSITRQDLINFTAKNLVLMRGTADTVRDSNLNIDSLSDVQGKNRYQRAGFFFQKGKEVNPSLRWILLDVPGTGHEYQKMAAAAAGYLMTTAGVYRRNPESLPQTMVLQNFPNPFNPSTSIVFSVQRYSKISVEIYSMLGKKIHTAAEGMYDRGVYTASFDGSAYASGVYYCRMRDEERSAVIKLFLLK